VHSVAVTHRSFDPGWADEVPYAAVVVELDEGPRILGAARSGTRAEFPLGRHVRVEVEAVNDDFARFWIVALSDDS
jgi:hypothetical protein